jgi:hypothetical protein
VQIFDAACALVVEQTPGCECAVHDAEIWAVLDRVVVRARCAPALTRLLDRGPPSRTSDRLAFARPISRVFGTASRVGRPSR